MHPTSPNHVSKSILVVDDDEAVRTVLTLILRHYGFTVMPASSGAEAIDLCRHGLTIPSAALLDVQMPELDGPSTLRGLLEACPGLPVMFITGESGRYSPELLQEMSGYPTISKPFTAGQLIQTVLSLFVPPVGIAPH